MSLLNKINSQLLLFLVLCQFLLSENKIFDPISLERTIQLGYDSNPLRLSQNEINELLESPYLLGSALARYSRFLSFGIKYKFQSDKTLLSLIFNNKKTFFSFGYNYKLYIENTDKSRHSFTFNIDQHLGNYKHVYFKYFLMPNYYLREYADLDLGVISDDIESATAYYSSTFTNEKVSLGYQHPIKRNRNIKVGILYEKQLFDKYFTEYDLKINGQFIQLSLKDKKHDVSLYYEKNVANNYTYLSGDYSTGSMDRSYKQERIKFTFKNKINKNQYFGIIADIYNRENTSLIITDELHYLRSHKDATFSIWYKINNHKFMISSRNRIANSPEEWVEDLKTFKRYIFTYTLSLKKIKYN